MCIEQLAEMLGLPFKRELRIHKKYELRNMAESSVPEKNISGRLIADDLRSCLLPRGRRSFERPRFRNLLRLSLFLGVGFFLLSPFHLQLSFFSLAVDKSLFQLYNIKEIGRA